MIVVDHVSKTYSGGKRANDDISLEIKKGEIYGLLGPNGAGKSTLLKMMTGTLNIDRGDIILNGSSITKKPFDAKKNFAFVSDSPDNFLRLTGIEYLNFIADVYEVSTDTRQERIVKLAQSLGMEEALGKSIQSYSHGMRQKMMVMGALVVNPPIWILDEPLIGLDPRSAFNLKKMMKEHAQAGNTVIFSTHVLEVAQNLVTRIGIINKGKLIFDGTFEELQATQHTDSSLEDIFLEMTDNDMPFNSTQALSDETITDHQEL